MSLLPQRKKSAEEIAKLRESIGVPGAQVPSAETPEIEETPIAPIAPPPDEEPVFLASQEAEPVHHLAVTPIVLHSTEHGFAPKEVHSFKRSERLATAPTPPEEEISSEKPITLEVRSLKPARNLRKSERLPSPPLPESPPDSNLPHQRHSNSEIADIRRREMLALMNAKPNAKLFPAHPVVLAPGYLASAAAALGIYFYDFSLVLTLALVSFSLLLATVIAFWKPISRHHSAFMVVLALFVIIYATLHYFPQLRHAS